MPANTTNTVDGPAIEELRALWQLFRRTSRGMSKCRERELDQFGISGDAVGVLFTVLTLGRDAIPAKIAKHLILEPHSVSQILSRMELDGLIRKVKDLERRNLVRIELTEKGLDLFNKCDRRESTNALMGVLSETERMQLWSVLVKLRDAALVQLNVRKPILYPPSDQYCAEVKHKRKPKRAQRATEP